MKLAKAEKNRIWANKILRSVSPEFRPRWEVFDDAIKNSLNPTTIWLDLGCGSNIAVSDYKHLASEAIGVDMLEPEDKENYVKADISDLPFPDNYADFVTLRFVVEHFKTPEVFFREIFRVLKPNGRVLFITTNKYSPLIFIPSLILTPDIKKWVLKRIFKVDDKDVFPTYHKCNSRRDILRVTSMFKRVKFEYLSDLNTVNKMIFMLFLSLHLISKLPGLLRIRTLQMVELQK